MSEKKYCMECGQPLVEVNVVVEPHEGHLFVKGDRKAAPIEAYACGHKECDAFRQVTFFVRPDKSRSMTRPPKSGEIAVYERQY